MTDTAKLELIGTAHVTVAPPIPAGIVGGAQRLMIPLTGGHVTGLIEGEVLNYGADWPLIYPDGRTVVDAHYVIKASNGDLIQVHNYADMKGTPPGEPAWTRPSFIAPDGPNAWLNHGSYVGRLTAAVEQGFVTVEYFKAVTAE
jgi:hypothetical protein